MMNTKQFTHVVSVRGDFNTTYHFSSKKEQEAWMEEELPKLKEKYTKLFATPYKLDPLKIGDLCNVVGEGTERFQIIDIIKYEEHRYGFLLCSGDTEQIEKCYPWYLIP